MPTPRNLECFDSPNGNAMDSNVVVREANGFCKHPQHVQRLPSLPAGSLRASMRDEANLFDPLSSRPAVAKNCSEGKAFECVVQGTVFFGVLFIGYVYKNRWFYLVDGIKPKVLSPWNASISNQTNLTRTPIVLYRLPRSCACPQPQLSCSQFPF